MGRIVVTEFVSLDGVVEAPGGGENFKHGGWSFEISRGEEGDNSSSTKPCRPRRCCWAGDLRGLRCGLAVQDRRVGFADKFNSMPKYVVSSTSRTPSGTTRPS